MHRSTKTSDFTEEEDNILQQAHSFFSITFGTSCIAVHFCGNGIIDPVWSYKKFTSCFSKLHCMLKCKLKIDCKAMRDVFVEKWGVAYWSISGKFSHSRLAACGVCHITQLNWANASICYSLFCFMFAVMAANGNLLLLISHSFEKLQFSKSD